jgi:hypothetical protein
MLRRRCLTLLLVALSIAFVVALTYPAGRAESSERLIDERVPAFERRLPEVRFDDVPLEKAFALIAEMAQANLVIDWGAVEKQSEISRSSVITLHLKDVTFRQALSVLLDLGSKGEPQLGCYTDGDAIVVVPTGYGYGRRYTRVYEIRDIIDGTMRFVRAHATPGAVNEENDYKYWVDTITAMLQSTISPDAWDQRGGLDQMNELGGRLIVTTNLENHRRIEALLQGMRDPVTSPLNKNNSQ